MWNRKIIRRPPLPFAFSSRNVARATLSPSHPEVLLYRCCSSGDVTHSFALTKARGLEPERVAHAAASSSSRLFFSSLHFFFFLDIPHTKAWPRVPGGGDSRILQEQEHRPSLLERLDRTQDGIAVLQSCSHTPMLQLQPSAQTWLFLTELLKHY